MIPIISSISSFEMTKVNPFSALMASHSLIFLSNLSIADEVALVANFGKTPFAKGTTIFVSVSLPNLPIILPRNPPD